MNNYAQNWIRLGSLAKDLWMDVLELLGSRNGDAARINN